jgi:hypothetical protein
MTIHEEKRDNRCPWKGAGLPDFSWNNVPNLGKNIPNDYKITKMYPVIVQYSKWPVYITTFSIPRSSKIYPNWDFWFEKKPFGNPGKELKQLPLPNSIVFTVHVEMYICTIVRLNVYLGRS